MARFENTENIFNFSKETRAAILILASTMRMLMSLGPVSKPSFFATFFFASINFSDFFQIAKNANNWCRENVPTKRKSSKINFLWLQMKVDPNYVSFTSLGGASRESELMATHPNLWRLKIEFPTRYRLS